ncbi:lasso peptide biosynthesis PqqD family chaperone [Streptomyces sp. NPDC048106]|uniref:lasso peptide biosynthesis PqqD family chaperone n=1 Tax=Streptomyces sp. NPDC048106 TaxID=3155750 RepID=UPI0034562C73
MSSTTTQDGTVLLHQRTGRYFQLNTTGSYVLHQLLNGRPTQQIAADLADRHGIPPEQTQRDVTAVIGQLHASQLLVSP